MGIKILFTAFYIHYLYRYQAFKYHILPILFVDYKHSRKMYLTNVRLSFPKLNEAERLKLYKQFQRHLLQLGVEMLKMQPSVKNLY